MQHDAPPQAADGKPPVSGWRLRGFIPLVVLLMAVGGLLASGWHRELTMERLIAERAAIDAFVKAHGLAATFAFAGVYAVVTGVGLPGAIFLTLLGGLFLGAIAGGAAALAGATLGSTIIFLVARTAFGAGLATRAGALAARLAAGFRRNAFSYLLFLRLVPLFPFYLVNIVPALCNVSLKTYLAATVLGMIPATFAFAMVGAGMDDVMQQHLAALQTCQRSGASNCAVDLDFSTLEARRFFFGLTAIGLLALLPPVVRKFRCRSAGADVDAASS